MNYFQLKQDIIAYSQEIGIDKIGFTTAEPFVELKERLKLQHQLNYQSGFEESDIEKRTEPELLLAGAKSIISIALAYPAKMKNAPKSTKQQRRGFFCRASWGLDYHIILRDRLDKLAAFIIDKAPDTKIKTMVDTGELSDRAVAERAGIGWSGKNTSIVTTDYGSYLYLGEMITTIPFPPDQPIENLCGTCNKCVDACPTAALIQPGQLNSHRCLAFLTQTKGFVDDQFREKLGNWVYGCDICQTICPYNKKIDFHHHSEMEPDPEIVKPDLKSLLSISNKEFKEKFGPISGSWRGKKPIQRNAIMALAHYKDQTAVNELAKVLSDDVRPVIRGTAAWALGKIGGEEAKQILENVKQHEQDSDVQMEIDKGLTILAQNASNNSSEEG